MNSETKAWSHVEDTENAFPSDWRKQCDIAEAEAIDGWPSISHDGLRERATISLWLGVYERNEIPKAHNFRITARKYLVCDTTYSDGGAFVTRNDGTDVPAMDVYVIVKCSYLRKMIGRGR